MAEKKRTRINSKIEQLPPEIKSQVDLLLSNMSNTFVEISAWLKAEGFDISRGAVGRYSLQANKAAARIAESLQKSKAIIDMVEQHPDMDAAKASQAIMMDGLMQRLSTAEEEYMTMPLEDAGRLLASFRRVDIADRKLKLDQRKRIDLAFEGLEEQLMASIKATPELAERLRQTLVEAKTSIVNGDG